MEGRVQVFGELQEFLRVEGADLPVVLFNGAVCTTAGLYRVTDMDVAEARQLVQTHGYMSAVEHHYSAEILSSNLQMDEPKNRNEYRQKIGQKAIALKLNVRPPEGRILTAAEMFQIGFGLK